MNVSIAYGDPEWKRKVGKRREKIYLLMVSILSSDPVF